MNFKDILVHIDNTQQCATRLDLAIRLARKHEACLTGLYVVTHPHYQPQSGARSLMALEAEQMFRLNTDGAGVDTEYLAVDWGVVGVNVGEVLNCYAHARDLIIIGQTDPGSREDGVPEDLPERVVVGSGRPVLIVPYAGTFGTIGEQVIVGWKAGRASARAVNDAMPFLLNAEQVCVLTIQTVNDHQPADKRTDCDICTHLKRYNINVKEENLMTADIPIADIMMNYAWENGCDLIVVGAAHVHTSRGSTHPGPVVKDLLDKMTLPVLMSY
jgi:nucleotide-binding universal stress UspA family protein